ncbi:MAG: signal peptidase I, partial [Candidatus Coproplasma sp.]
MKDGIFEPELLDRRERDNSIGVIPIIVLILILIAIVSFNATYQRIYVVGSSMEDTLYGAPDANPENPGGDFVYVFAAEPQRGDIAVIRAEDKVLIKRVVAVGGDRIKIDRGVVYINGKAIDEPYISEDNNNPILNNFPETKIEEGYVF